MEKSDVKAHESQSDTSSVINMKEYAPSEYPSSEPPPDDPPTSRPPNKPTPIPPEPYHLAVNVSSFAYILRFWYALLAYMKPHRNALRIARLAAFTIITSAVILGGFILAASWIQANTARNLDLTLNQELMDDLHPSYEHLVANEVLPEQQDNSVSDNNEQKQQEEVKQEQQVPLQQQIQEEKPSLELDEIAKVLMQKGMRGNVNCIVEKRKNEELVDHAPRALTLPFGLNITTPPRLQHLTGEQVVIICKDDNEEKREEEEEKEQMQPMMLPIPPQLLSQIQQIPQVIPLSQLLQHLPQPQAPQQPMFLPQQPEQQVFFHPQAQQQQPLYHPQQQQPLYHPQQPQPMYQPQQQQPMYHAQPQRQQVVYEQPQQQYQPQPQQVFMPPMQPMYRPQMQQQATPQQQQIIIPLRSVPLNEDNIPMNHVQHRPMPINPLAIQDVPLREMPLTHMPLRQQPTPVHHLVPPRPQPAQIENFGSEESEESMRPRIPPFLESIIQRELAQSRPRPLPLVAQPRPFPMERPSPIAVEAREPRMFRGPIIQIEGNSIREERPMPPRFEINREMPQFPPRFPLPQRELPPRYPPGRPFRFPESENGEGVAQITRIIPIRVQKESSDENDSEGNEEKQLDLPIPLKAFLNMVIRGMHPMMGNRTPFPVPIDIKIERIEKPAMPVNMESEGSQEDVSEESMEDEKTEQESTEAPKIQELEIVEKEGENTQAIPIPADAEVAQVFKLEEKPEEQDAPAQPQQWEGRSFLPNGQGRGGVFPIPQESIEGQIFTVSDARAGVPVGASFDVAPEDKSQEGRMLENPEGEMVIAAAPEPEHSVRLYPVKEEGKTQEEPKVELTEESEAGRVHFMQPRSV